MGAVEDEELQGFSAWLSRQGRPAQRIGPLTGDVSLRRYYRVWLESGGTAVLAAYPQDLQPVCRRFLMTESLLAHAGVDVPRVLATRCDDGLTLLEDAGDLTLHAAGADLDWSALLPLYRRAVSYIAPIQGLSVDVVGAINPALDAERLRWELDTTWQAFLAPRGLVGDDPQGFSGALDLLCTRLAGAPPVPCHRDYMPRNLMLPEGAGSGRLLVLDHQDLRLGPATYDIASLLNDSLFPPPGVEDELLAMAGLSADEPLYRRAVVQRSLKAIGNYVQFAARGFDRHLRLVAPTLRRAWRHLPHLPELAPWVGRLQPAWVEVLGGEPLLD